MSFERASAIADAVLLEGYALYPYRASALKNRYRWSFGVLAPRAWSEARGTDPWWLEAQVLVEEERPATLDLRLRLLQLERRQVLEHTAGGERPVASLEVNGELHVPWDEGLTREIDLRLDLERAREGTLELPFAIPANQRTQLLCDASKGIVGSVVREQWALWGVVHVRCEPLAAAQPLSRVIVRVENLTPAHDLDAPREDALRGALLSTHLLLASSGAPFVSLHDPPAWAREHAQACRNVGTHPVLAGDEGERQLLLSAPIILYDHPRIAPESPGDFFDATEIDALLTLRTQALSDDEKREVQATDPRTAAILARADTIPLERMEGLYGAVRELERIEGGEPRPSLAPFVGMRVRPLPSTRRTDAQDALFVGRAATVEKVEHDVDGRVFLALTFDDDPAAEVNRARGRFHYYTLDEVEPLPPGGEAAA